MVQLPELQEFAQGALVKYPITITIFKSIPSIFEGNLNHAFIFVNNALPD